MFTLNLKVGELSGNLWVKRQPMGLPLGFTLRVKRFGLRENTLIGPYEDDS